MISYNFSRVQIISCGILEFKFINIYSISIYGKKILSLLAEKPRPCFHVDSTSPRLGGGGTALRPLIVAPPMRTATQLISPSLPPPPLPAGNLGYPGKPCHPHIAAPYRGSGEDRRPHFSVVVTGSRLCHLLKLPWRSAQAK